MALQMQKAAASSAMHKGPVSISRDRFMKHLWYGCEARTRRCFQYAVGETASSEALAAKVQNL